MAGSVGGSLDIYSSGDTRKPLRPHSNYVYTGSLWVPMLGAADGSVSIVASEPAGTATIATPLASGLASAQFLAANTARRGLILNNTDGFDCYIKYGITASTVSFSAIVRAGTQWVMPEPIYTGRIDAIWEGDGTGSLYGTELST